MWENVTFLTFAKLENSLEYSFIISIKDLNLLTIVNMSNVHLKLKKEQVGLFLGYL